MIKILYLICPLVSKTMVQQGSNTILLFRYKNGKNIGLKLLINQILLLKKCKLKIKENGKILQAILADLSNFKIITDVNKKVVAIDFFLFDTQYRNSGYEEHIIHFEWKEIYMHISPFFKKRLM